MFFHPASRARNHFYTCFPCLQVVAISSLRGGKLNGDVGTLEGLAVEVLLIININDTYNLVTTADGYLFNHLTHLAVAD